MKNNAQRLIRDFKLSKTPKEVGKSLYILKQDLGICYLKARPVLKQKNKLTCQKAREESIKVASDTHSGKGKAITKSKGCLQASI